MKKLFIAVAAIMVMGGVGAFVTPAIAADASSVCAPAKDSIDEMLDEYEKYVDRYIAAMKKSKSGDKSAAVEYIKLADQARKLADKIEKVKDDMSAAQAARYVKITQKMAKAM
jgi:CHASE3 domain sensor protein